MASVSASELAAGGRQVQGGLPAVAFRLDEPLLLLGAHEEVHRVHHPCPAPGDPGAAVRAAQEAHVERCVVHQQDALLQAPAHLAQHVGEQRRRLHLSGDELVGADGVLADEPSSFGPHQRLVGLSQPDDPAADGDHPHRDHGIPPWIEATCLEVERPVDDLVPGR
jgi:hypothetical protein